MLLRFKWFFVMFINLFIVNNKGEKNKFNEIKNIICLINLMLYLNLFLFFDG